MPLDVNDKNLIQAAIARGGDVWSDETLSVIKRKIKLYCLQSTAEQCCYCRTNFTNEFMMVMDIEHILPKHIYDDYMFELFNLSVSCKRCNMNIKRERTDFLVDENQIRQFPMESEQYLLIHPNLDNYFQNLNYLTLIINSEKFIKYIPRTEKGEFTFTFFNLNQREIETLNEAQGIVGSTNELSDNISPELVNTIEHLINQLKS